MAVSDWSTSAASNTTVGAINIAENCPSANLNNAIREVMAQVRAFSDDLGTAYQGKDALLTALAGLTTAADQLVYATGSDTFAVTALTAFARSILDDADAAAVCTTIGAVRVAALSLGVPGYIKFQVGASSYFQIAWGTAVAQGDSYVTVSYPVAFPNAAVPVISGTSRVTNSAEQGSVVTSATASGFTFYTSEGGAANTGTAWWIAVGY